MSKTRHLGIDALKIVAMAMVVMHHFLKPFLDCGLDYSIGLSGLVIQFSQAFCLCAVDCFVMASGFIMCQRTWNKKRIISLWCQVVFYSLLLVVVAFWLSPELKIGWRDFLGAIFPICNNRYWFVTQYVALFFTMPSLNVFLKAASSDQKKYLLVGGCLLLSIIPFVAGHDLFFTHFGFSYLWFVYLYIVGGIVALMPDPFLRIPTKWLMLLIIAFALLAIVGERCGHFLTDRYSIGGRLSELYCNYTSPCLFAEAFCMLILFMRWPSLPAWAQRICIIVMPSNFVVYIVHCNKEFYAMTHWSTLLIPCNIFGGGGVVLTCLCCTILLFSAIVCIDMVRRNVLKFVFSLLKRGMY